MPLTSPSVDRPVRSAVTPPGLHAGLSFADGLVHETTFSDDRLTVQTTGGDRSLWRVDGPPDEPRLAWIDGPQPGAAQVLAALEATFIHHPAGKVLHVTDADRHPEALRYSGVFLPDVQGQARVCRDLLWQQPRLWLPTVHAPMPSRHALTNGRYHPLRPPKSTGVLYQRFIPWLSQTLTFRAVDTATDLPRFSRWMNDPHVAKIWEEQGDLDKHRQYLDAIQADPHMHAMIASLDGEAFGYFEVYWAKESRIAPFYDADDYDRGWHVLIGEPSFRGRAIATAWLTSISHYLFLCDPRTQRAVGEPRIDHMQQIRNLDRSGYAKVKEFDLPHKRALLVVMLRERYFIDTCWLPRGDEPTASVATFPQRTPSW